MSDNSGPDVTARGAFTGRIQQDADDSAELEGGDETAQLEGSDPEDEDESEDDDDDDIDPIEQRIRHFEQQLLELKAL